MPKVPTLAILASGSGSNAEKIVRYSRQTQSYRVGRIISNNPSAGVLERAHRLQVESQVIPNSDFKNGDALVTAFKDIDFIILAGFLRLIPPALIRSFPERILNIHPALLPLYGGKGMYGRHVHEAIWNAKEPYSGCTIHLVDEEYDRGKILFQASTPISSCSSSDEIAKKVQILEHAFFPLVIEQYVKRYSAAQDNKQC